MSVGGQTPGAGQDGEGRPNRVVAVIDVGTTSVRMAIAQIDASGEVIPLDSFQQSVELGKDTFTKGYISAETTEACVETLRSFRRAMDEYGITQPDRIKAVATSAVREAANRQAFLDRIYIATGIDVNDIDDAEVNRYTYLSVKSLLDAEPEIKGSDVLIVEVGGGSTEFLGVKGGEVVFSHAYRLGSLRMREMLEDFRAPRPRLPGLLESHIRSSIKQIQIGISGGKGLKMLALGSDARFAATQVTRTWDQTRPVALNVDALGSLAARVLELSVDDLVRVYHLSYPDAETLGPALLTYTRLAQAMGLEQVLVVGASLRDGLLADMARRSWTDDFTHQIVRSAMALGSKYGYDEAHARNVMDLTGQLFRGMKSEHQLTPWHELILTVAALLHDIGFFVGSSGHHKHSMYLIQNSDLFGLSARDMFMAGLVARYHRKALPAPLHEGYAGIDRDSRIGVSKMAALLRVADALDRPHRQRIKKVKVALEPGRLVLTTARHLSDLTLEELALRQKGVLLERVYGRRPILRAGGEPE